MIPFNSEREYEKYSRKIYTRFTTEIAKIERYLQNPDLDETEREEMESFQRRIIIERRRYRINQNPDVFEEKYD